MDLERTTFDVLSDVVSLVVALVPFVVIPTVGVSATADRPPTYLLPAMGLGVVLLLGTVGRFPRHFNYLWAITEANAAVQYRLAVRLMAVLKLAMAFAFAGLGIGTATGLGESATGAIAIGLEVVLLGAVIIYLVISRRHR